MAVPARLDRRTPEITIVLPYGCRSSDSRIVVVTNAISFVSSASCPDPGPALPAAALNARVGRDGRDELELARERRRVVISCWALVARR